MTTTAKGLSDFERMRASRRAPSRPQYRGAPVPTAEWDLSDGTTLVSPSGRKAILTVDVPAEWAHDIAAIATTLGITGPDHARAPAVLRRLVLEAMRRHRTSDVTRFVRATRQTNLPEEEWVHSSKAAEYLGVNVPWLSRLTGKKGGFGLHEYRRGCRWGKGYELPRSLVEYIYGSHEYHRYMQRQGRPVPGGRPPAHSLYDTAAALPPPSWEQKRERASLFTDEELAEAEQRIQEREARQKRWWEERQARDAEKRAQYVKAQPGDPPK